MDTVWYVRYRRAGGKDSPLAWEVPEPRPLGQGPPTQGKPARERA